jgi:uncharacterized damage-inducible protein DinB
MKSLAAPNRRMAARRRSAGARQDTESHPADEPGGRFPGEIPTFGLSNSSYEMMDQLVDTWAIQNRINLYLLDAIADEALESRLGARGRSIGEQLAHINNVRLMWLKEGAADLLEGLEKLEKGDDLTRRRLASALAASGAAIERLLERGLESGKIRGFKPHPAAFLGYLIAHEAHHRGQIILTLKSTGFTIDKKTSYGLWEWGVR